MKMVLTVFSILTMLAFSMPAHAGFRAYKDTTDLKVAAGLRCSGGMTCPMENGAILKIRPGITGMITVGAATTLTADQCGETFINSGAFIATLPLASTVIGCQYTFATNNASTWGPRANAADQILVATTGVGRAATNSTLGNTITIQATAANRWVQLAVVGTWADTP